MTVVLIEVSQRMIHQWVIRMTHGNESQVNWNKVEEICQKANAEIKSTNQNAEWMDLTNERKEKESSQRRGIKETKFDMIHE